MFVGVASLRTRDRDPLEISVSLVRGRFWWCLGYVFVLAGLYLPTMIVVAVLGIAQELLGLPPLIAEAVSDVMIRFCDSALVSTLLYVAFVMLHAADGEVLPPMRWRTSADG